MPAMESRIQAPSLYSPSAEHSTAWAVSCTCSSLRMARMLMVSPSSSCKRADTSSMVSTSVELIWVMMSPSRRPQSLAGFTAPFWVEISEVPTTTTPSEKSLMPTARPTGTTFKVSALALPRTGHRARATTSTTRTTRSTAWVIPTHGLISSFNDPHRLFVHNLGVRPILNVPETAGFLPWKREGLLEKPEMERKNFCVSPRFHS